MCIKMNILNCEKYYKVKRYRTGWKKYSQGWKLFVTHIANKGLTLKKKIPRSQWEKDRKWQEKYIESNRKKKIATDTKLQYK